MKTQAQNLLLNGDFEDYTSCPEGVSTPTQTPYEIAKCVGWTAPTYGTSDYFNYCAAPGPLTPINNTLGYQVPKSGLGFLGAFFASITGGAGWDGYSGDMWWEYVSGQFINELETGKMYKIKMYISLAEYSDLSLKEFGAYISNNPVSSPNTASLNLAPQLKFVAESYFSDTLNWMPVEGTYIASGGEKYITIGNFKTNSESDTLRNYIGSPFNPNVSYYFIDAAEVTEVTNVLPISNIFTPNGDGINDEWILPEDLIDYEIYIFNRWGNEILKSPAKKFGWNGKNNQGKECNDGTYFYLIKNINTKANSLKGFIQLTK